MLGFADRGVEFLDSGDDELGVIGELLDKLCCVVGTVDASFGEAVEFCDRLVIKVFATFPLSGNILPRLFSRTSYLRCWGGNKPEGRPLSLVQSCLR